MASKKDFDKFAPPATNDHGRVSEWRLRIRGAEDILRIQERVDAAMWAEQYIYTDPKAVNRKAGSRKGGRGILRTRGNQTYFNYLLPILTDTFTRSIPRVPSPTVGSRSGSPADLEERVRQFLHIIFRKEAVNLRDVGRAIQWDDARYGACVLKAEWNTSFDKANPEQEMDDELMEQQIDVALAENADAQDAKISADDSDMVHLHVHLQGLAGMAEEDSDAMRLHIDEHNARLLTIKTEAVELRRINVPNYLYDPYVPWKKRTWEAEAEMVRVDDLLNSDAYRNVTPDIISPYIPEADWKAYESVGRVRADLMAKVWHIHDITNDKWYTIADEESSTGNEKFIRKLDWPFPTDIYLLKVFRTHDADCTYGEATLLATSTILDELAEVDFNIQRHVKTHSGAKIFTTPMAGNTKLKSDILDSKKVHVEMSEEALSLLKTFTPPAIPDTLLVRRNELLVELYRQVQSDAQDTGIPNPHAVTAQESGRREFVSESRNASRQEILADIYTWYAETAIALYRQYSRIKIPAMIRTPEGQLPTTIDPAKIPLSFDIFVDIQADSDQTKALKVETMFRLFEVSMTSQAPVDIDEWMTTLYALEGLDYEKFRQDLPVGPENMQVAPGPGGSMPNEDNVLTMPNNQTFQSAVQEGAAQTA